jgi:tetratricopeptide (TPR) repeat protein
MRQAGRLAVLILLGMSCVGASSPAQTSNQQNITVIVLNALPQPPQPVKAVRVSLSYLQSSVQVTDAQEVTNSQGQALLLVSPGVAQRGDLRIGITGADNLAIYQPADGQLNGLPPTVNVSLLPKGSAALLGPAQIEAMLHRALLQVNSLQKQVAAQKQTGAQQDQNSDLGATITEWAQANGFSETQVNQQVEQWAQSIQSQTAKATNDQKALAELALKHYASAAQLFNQASDADRQAIGSGEAQEQALESQVKALEAAQQAVLDKLRAPVRQLIDHSEQAAGAYQLNKQYHEATQTLESAAATAEAEYKKHPTDKGFQVLWLAALAATADARWQEGKISAASESLPLLAQSANDFKTLSQQYDNLGDRSDWAWAQTGLGIALKNEGLRDTGDKAAAFYAEAVQAFESALQVYTKAALPQGWAATQNDLGNTLDDEAVLATGDKATTLFDQAVEAFNNALEVRTKAAYPEDWAITENNLASMFDDEGERATGDEAAGYFDQAVQAYQLALQVQTKADHPQDWAMLENNLGIALQDEGGRASGDKAVALYKQGVEAFRNALQVYTQADLPQYWAATQNNLGAALKNEGQLASGDAAIALFDQSVQAYQQALLVRTKADLPQDWAATEYNLGNALLDEAGDVANDKSADLLARAVEAYQNALQVYTKADMPLDWANAQVRLGNAFLYQGEGASADKSAALFAQADQAYKNALEVDTRVDNESDWVLAEEGLGIVDMQLKNYEAAAADDELALQARPDSITTLDRVSNIYHEHLFRFDLALADDQHRIQLDPSPETRMDLAEANLTTDHFDVCLQQAAMLPDSVLSPQLIVVRDTLQLACQWASGNKAAAVTAEKSVSSLAATVKTHSWTFAGTIHFISDSPAFATGRTAWIALFTALQTGDSSGMSAALQQLEPLMQN